MSLSKSPLTYEEEKALHAQGYSLVAGLDEVGRGPLAGPVVAGVVVLPPEPQGTWVGLIRDSKQMTVNQRNLVLPYLEQEALAVSTGFASHREIDQIGIAAATRLAMQRGLESLSIQPQFLILDAFPLPEVQIPQKPIIRGDSLCLSIAAASVVAKVTRDCYMEGQDVLYPRYGFAKNKGYPTQDHLKNLRTFGPSPIHRMSFAPVANWRDTSQ